MTATTTTSAIITSAMDEAIATSRSATALHVIITATASATATGTTTSSGTERSHALVPVVSQAARCEFLRRLPRTANLTC